MTYPDSPAYTDLAMLLDKAVQAHEDVHTWISGLTETEHSRRTDIRDMRGYDLALGVEPRGGGDDL